MGALRFADLQAHPTEVLDLTSPTMDEFRQLVPSFKTAFQAHMAAWRLDGQPQKLSWLTRTLKYVALLTLQAILMHTNKHILAYARQVARYRSIQSFFGGLQDVKL